MRARGGDLTAKSISSVGGLNEYLCSGVGTFNFFWQRDWDQDKSVVTWHRLSWLWNGMGFGEGEFFINVYLLLHRPSNLLKNVFRTLLL